MCEGRECERGGSNEELTDLLRPELRAWNHRSPHLLYTGMVFETALIFAPFCC